MYKAFGIVMGAMIGCAIMALYKLGMSMTFAGALAGGGLGAIAELVLPLRKYSNIG
jgi:hypothetical protein